MFSIKEKLRAFKKEKIYVLRFEPHLIALEDHELFRLAHLKDFLDLKQNVFRKIYLNYDVLRLVAIALHEFAPVPLPSHVLPFQLLHEWFQHLKKNKIRVLMKKSFTCLEDITSRNNRTSKIDNNSLPF